MKLLADVISSKLQIYHLFFSIFFFLFFFPPSERVCEISRILPAFDLWPTFDQLLSGSHKPFSDAAHV